MICISNCPGENRIISYFYTVFSILKKKIIGVSSKFFAVFNRTVGVSGENKHRNCWLR